MQSDTKKQQPTQQPTHRYFTLIYLFFIVMCIVLSVLTLTCDTTQNGFNTVSKWCLCRSGMFSLVFKTSSIKSVFYDCFLFKF